MTQNKHHKIPAKVSLLILFVLAVLLQPACGPDYFFQETKAISGGQWAYRDTLDFRFTVTDTLETYNLYLDFEYADTFSTQNLYVKLHTQFPDGKRLSKQKSFDLFDDQGKPHGKCSGGTCKQRTLLQEQAFFNRPGTYVITLEQYTRIDPLPGLQAAGLTMEATGIKRKD
jgi:gliding motility-associated lipoprotein GldH